MSFAKTGQQRDPSRNSANRDLEHDGESVGIICKVHLNGFKNKHGSKHTGF
ncbi:hypothetical protein [Bradyrhizobium sp. STM 3557]|uniref:hypothetical protein n=1 Tax=Bradyrhizobium sp. STM 3557 TaxID=578920 RepID=UPI00388F2C70